MKKHVCSRCRTLDVIPTHQFVKFDTTVQPLCGDCWQGFRAWFFAGEKIARIAEPEVPPTERSNEVA